MADNELERIYTIPLRKAHHGTRPKRTNRAIRDIRAFLTRHMKSDEVWIGNDVNEAIWSRGKFRIPSRIRVRATRFDDGVVEVTLPESDSEGSVRATIMARQEKAAETPVLAGAMALDDEEEEAPGSHTSVTEIAGIGPAMAEKLEKVEVETIADLLGAGKETLMEASGKDDETVTGWLEQAEEIAGAKAVADDSEE